MSATPTARPLDLLKRPFEAWNRFWFTPADPTVLSFIRILAGLAVIYVHLAYTFDLYELLGPTAWLDPPTINKFRYEAPVVGPSMTWDELPTLKPFASPEERLQAEAFMREWELDPRMAFTQGRWLTSIWFHVQDPRWMPIVHGIGLFFMALFTIGLGTRIAAVVTWLFVLSYIQRAMTTLFGMDTIMIVVVLYLMLGPSGAALSVDRLLSRYWLTRRALRKGEPIPDLSEPRPLVSANVALRLMQVHLCIIYFVAGISKLQGSTWWSGTAAWSTVANYEFAPFHYAYYMSSLRWLSQNRFLWEAVMTSATMATVAFEVIFPFMVWFRPTRWLMIVSAVLMHTAIAVLMGLVTFSLMMITLLFAFVPPEALRRLLNRIGRNADQFQLYFDPQQAGAARVASLVHATDVWNQVEIAPSTGQARLVTAKGEVLTGTQLIGRLARSLRGLWPLNLVLWLPGLGTRAWSRFAGEQSPEADSKRAA